MAGNIINNFIKPLGEVPALMLPAGANAGGIRPGTVNALCACVPADIAVHNTGHEIKKFCALAEYLDASLPLSMPGAVVLAGFPPLPWGHLGMGPVPASLDALLVGSSIIDLFACGTCSALIYV